MLWHISSIFLLIKCLLNVSLTKGAKIKISSNSKRYVHHPDKEKVTNDWLSAGQYDIEAMGVRYPATLQLKSPFDAGNLRIQGKYEEIDLRY